MIDISREIYINCSISSNRIAVLEAEELVQLFVDFPSHTKMVGNIYNGKVQNVIPGIQAAFIDIDYEINAFLPLSEIEDQNNFKNISFNEEDENTKKSKKSKKSKNNFNELKIDDKIIVQVVKEPFAGKGPRITTEISIPGALIVLIPNQNYIGISKKINDKYERRRLRKIITEFKPKNIGIIVRTTAQGKNQEVLAEEFESLMKQYKSYQNKAKSNKGSSLIHEDVSVASKVIRDLFNKQVKSLYVDSKKVYNDIYNYVKKINPQDL